MSIKYYATEQYVDEAIAGLGGGVTSWNDLTDRPFGETVELVEIVPEQSINNEGNFPVDVPKCEWYIDDDSYDLFNRFSQQKIIFTLNGVNYTTYVKVADNGDGYFGDINVTDVPFYYHLNDGSFMWSSELGETITLAIYAEQEVVKPLDYKFMPEGYPKVNNSVTEIVTEQTVNAMQNNDGVYMTELNTTVGIIPGNKYVIVIDGIRYEATAKDVMGMPVVGDAWLLGAPVDSTGESFAFLVDENYLMFCWKEPASNTITLRIHESDIEPIAYKFMPNGYPTIETKLIEVVPEHTLTCTHFDDYEYDDYSLHNVQVKPIYYDFEIGKKYEIVMNGVSYKCVCGGQVESYVDSRYLEVYKGDTTVFNYFHDYMMSQNGCFIQWNADFGDTITLAIYEEQEIITPMDSKFLPDADACVVIFQLNEDIEIESCNKTFTEVQEAFYAGKPIYAYVVNSDGSNMSSLTIQDANPSAAFSFATPARIKSEYEGGGVAYTVYCIGARDENDYMKFDYDYPTEAFATEQYVDDRLSNIHIEVDAELSSESENPVQNKVVSDAINRLNDLAQAQADWNENDSTQASYIIGRTHYEAQTELSLYNGMPTAQDATGNNVKYYSNFAIDDSQLAGVEDMIIKYKLTTQSGTISIEDQATCYTGTSGYEHKYYVVGNQSLLNGLTSPVFNANFGTHTDTGENYAVVIKTQYSNGVMMPGYSRAYVLIKQYQAYTKMQLSVITTVVTQLPEKFIPDTIARMSDVEDIASVVEDVASSVVPIERGGTGQTSIVDTTYTTPRYRASALVTTETNPTSNGVITWIYE